MSFEKVRPDLRNVRRGTLSVLATKPAATEGAFLQCSNCKKILFTAEFEENLRVCPYCGHHHRLTARQRIDFTVDPGSFTELDTEISSLDTLGFEGYQAKLDSLRSQGQNGDSMISGTASIEGNPISIAVADFAYIGGSMGSVAGEKVTRTIERGIEQKMPAVIFCASGGARMQEGLLSLMQMAKTTAAAQRASAAGVPYIAVFTDPTMAGVLASYASIADVILAEPKALVGFAGLRVSKQAGVGKVPDDFQTAEFVHKHGMIDRIVARKEMRGTLATSVKALGAHLRRAA
jgi:acetyl-CoA carboxylase carboxyl transferase subunit beta